MPEDEYIMIINNLVNGGDYYYATTDRVMLKKLLLNTSGKLTVNGEVRNIKYKHLGVGVYNIFLEKKKEE